MGNLGLGLSARLVSIGKGTLVGRNRWVKVKPIIRVCLAIFILVGLMTTDPCPHPGSCSLLTPFSALAPYWPIQTITEEPSRTILNAPRFHLEKPPR